MKWYLDIGSGLMEPNWIGGRHPHVDGFRLKRKLIRWCENNLHFKPRLKEDRTGYYVEFPTKEAATLCKLFWY